MWITHVKRGVTGGLVISTCSFVNKHTPEGVKKIGKTIGEQTCFDAFIDYADSGFQIVKIQTTFTRYAVKGRYLFSFTSATDFSIRAGIVIIPEVFRIVGTLTPYKFLVPAASILDAALIKELDKHVLPESIRVRRFNKLVEFVELLPKYIKTSSFVTKVKNFLDLKGGSQLQQVKYVLRVRPGTAGFQDPTSRLYYPIFKMKSLRDNYNVLEWMPVIDSVVD